MKRVFSVGAGVLSLLVPLSGCSKPIEQRYFPLRDGEVREYSVASVLDKSGQRSVIKKDRLTYRYEGGAHINGRVYHKQVATCSDTNFPTQIEYMRIDQRGVHIIEGKDDTRTEHVLIPFPMQVGNCWVAKRAGSEYNYRVEAVETVCLAERRFDACLKLSYKPIDRNASGHPEGYLYYAPDIGYVKEVVTFDNGLSITFMLIRLNSVSVCASETESDSPAVSLAGKMKPIRESQVGNRESHQRGTIFTPECEEARVCANGFRKYLDTLASPSPTNAFVQTLDLVELVCKVTDEYPKTMWESKFKAASEEKLSSPDYSLPLSKWVSAKYPKLSYEIIEVRKIPDNDLHFGFRRDRQEQLRRCVLSGYTVFLRITYDGDSPFYYKDKDAVFLVEAAVSEVLCKAVVYRPALDDPKCEVLVDNDFCEIVEVHFKN